MSKHKLKIAYMVGTLNQGGLESLVADICRMHAIADFEIVCIYRHEGGASDLFHSSGVRMIQLKCRHYLSYLYQLRKTLLAEKVDIVHAHTQSNALVSVLSLWGTSIPMITTLHGFSFADAGWAYCRFIYRQCKQLICVSQYQRQYYMRKWKLGESNKLQVVYNGIDFAKLNAVEQKNERVRELGNGGRIRLAMVGSFMEGRSQKVIVKSMQVLKESGITNFDFFFVGRRVDSEPWRYDECVKYCKENNLENVHFLGGRSDVPSLLKTMDGFVYSTEHDTFGIAVVEAMAAGLPVIVNDWVVMKEITNDGKWATLFRTDDVEDCADKMAELINELQHNKKRVQECTAQIAQEVRAKFSIENHIKQIRQVYKQIDNEK